MIARLAVLCACGAGAYALLRGMPGAFPPLVRACLAVLLLVGGLCCWAVRKREDDLPAAKRSVRPGWRDFLAVGAGVLALECGLLWLLSASPAPLEEVAVRIEERLRPGAAAERQATGGTSMKSGNWLWGSESSRALPRRTNLKPGVKPEVFVRLSGEEDAKKLLARKTYVRAFALDDFRNGAWSIGKPGDNMNAADGDGWIRLGRKRDGEMLHEIFHGKDAGGRDVLTALQGVRAVRLPELRVVADGMELLPPATDQDGYSYMAGSLPLALEDLRGRELRWELSPKPRGGRFSELAEKAAGDGDVLTKLLNIQAFLRGGYGYSLKTENPRDLDPLDNFLFAEKKGHCEFFATAGALMARELGVETRVAYGWAGGEYFKDSLMFVFRAREAHAWVEVKVPSHGWAVMEPTPPVVLGGGGGGMPRLAGAGEEPPSTEEILSEEEDAAAADGSRVGKIAAGMMLCFGVLAGLAFLLKRMAARPENIGGHVFPGATRKSGYLGAWRRVCEERGIRWPRGKTLKGQLAELPERPSFGDDLLAYHYAVKYEGKAPEKEREAELTQRIKGWE